MFNTEASSKPVTSNLKSENINRIPELLDQKYYPGLDGLRAIAIIFVLISHGVTNTKFQQKFDVGGIGVEIFFVISGFLITTLLLKELAINGKVSLKKFYIRRALRIVPVSWLFIAVVIVLNIVFTLHITIMGFLACLFYFMNMPIKKDWAWIGYIGHFWTLSIEEQFYLFFPVLLLWNRKITKWIIVILFFLIPIVTYLADHSVGVFALKTIHYIAYSFIFVLGGGSECIFIGCLLSILTFEGFIKKIPASKYLSLLIFLVAIALRVPSSPLFVHYLSVEIFSVLMGVIIIVNLNSENYFTKILSNKILVKIGVLSYSIYIWQQIFIDQRPWAHLFKYSDSLWLNMPVMLLVAYLSYHFYEKKFLTLKKRFIA